MKKNTTDVNLWENNCLPFKTETANSCHSSGSHGSPSVQNNNKGQRYRWRRQEGSPAGDGQVREVEKSNRKTRTSQNRASQSNTFSPFNFLLQPNVHSNGFVSVLPNTNIPPLPPRSFCRFLSESTVLQQKLSNVNFRRIDSTDESSSSRAKSSNSELSSKSNDHNGRASGQQTYSLKRSWQLTSFGKIAQKTGGKLPGFFFSVMSYNVLAQNLIEEHMYLYQEHIKKALEWEIRWSNLITEIKQLDPDILCLQEVQETHRQIYYDKFSELGYNGVYKQRTGIRSDGCAIFYKKDLFLFIEYTTVEFNQPNSSVLNRDNVAIVAKLAPKANPDKHFVVATTHLLYNPRRQDVRLAQVQVLFAEIDRIAYTRSSSQSTPYVPVILTGDLNSLPNSVVYEFIVNGQLHYENLSERTLSKTNSGKVGKTLVPSFLGITDHCQHESLLNKRLQNATLLREDELKLINLQHSDRSAADLNKVPTNKMLFSSGRLSHNLAFKSVYEHNVKNDTEGTTYQDEWVTVDYIFYSGAAFRNNQIKEDRLKLVARYSLPTTRQLTNIRVPNFTFGSDHLCLLAKFKLEF